MSKKLFNKIMIVDGSYMLHRNLKIPEVWDLKSKNGTRSGGIFGFLRSLNYAINSEYYPIICWDSGLSDRRLAVYPDYKSNLSRQKDYKLSDLANYMMNNPGQPINEDLSQDDIQLVKEKMKQIMQNRQNFGSDNDPDDYLYQYRTQRSHIINICDSLGIPSLKFKGWEGDDIITVLSRMAMKAIVITDDRDMIQLLTPSVDVNRIMNNQYLTYEQYLKDNNMKSIREMIIIKAIEGDGSDSIPGVTAYEEERKYKVGGTTAAKIAKIIIENEEDPEKYLPIIENTEGRDHNKFLGFVRNHEYYLRNMKLVDLSLVDNEYEIVDNIIAEINSHVTNANLIEVLRKLGELDIINVDVNGIMSKVMLSRQNALL